MIAIDLGLVFAKSSQRIQPGRRDFVFTFEFTPTELACIFEANELHKFGRDETVRGDWIESPSPIFAGAIDNSQIRGKSTKDEAPTGGQDVKKFELPR